MYMLLVLSQAVMNLDDREIESDVRIEARDFSKLHSFWPVIEDHSLMTSPNVEVVATMSPTAFVAIVSTADLCARIIR